MQRFLDGSTDAADQPVRVDGHSDGCCCKRCGSAGSFARKGRAGLEWLIGFRKDLVAYEMSRAARMAEKMNAALEAEG